MTRKSTDTCASCKEFPIEQARDNGGLAQCEMLDAQRAWRDAACGVLYTYDVEGRERRYVIAKMLYAQHPKENNDAGK